MSNPEPQSDDQRPPTSTFFLVLEKHHERGTPRPEGRLSDRTFTNREHLVRYVKQFTRPGIYMVHERTGKSLIAQHELTHNGDGSIAIEGDGHYLFEAGKATRLADHTLEAVATAIGEALTAQHPGISFTMSKGYVEGGGRCLEVDYEDGPISEQVTAFCGHDSAWLPKEPGYERQPFKLGAERTFCYQLQRVKIRRGYSLVYFEQVAALAKLLHIEVDPVQALQVVGSSYPRTPDSPACRWLIITATLLTSEQVQATAVRLSLEV